MPDTATKTGVLPSQFADLEKFSDWCLATEPERYRRVRDAVLRSEDSEEGSVRMLGRTEFVVLRQAMIDAQRGELLELRDEGSYGAQVLTEALARLDAEQITIDLYRTQ